MPFCFRGWAPRLSIGPRATRQFLGCHPRVTTVVFHQASRSVRESPGTLRVAIPRGKVPERQVYGSQRSYLDGYPSLERARVTSYERHRGKSGDCFPVAAGTSPPVAAGTTLCPRWSPVPGGSSPVVLVSVPGGVAVPGGVSVPGGVPRWSWSQSPVESSSPWRKVPRGDVDVVPVHRFIPVFIDRFIPVRRVLRVFMVFMVFTRVMRLLP